METLEHKIAKSLLQINAIKFNPANPFLWSSGWKSPIYCDNRRILSYPEIRNLVKNTFVQKISNMYENPDVIAAVATGAIAIGAVTADALGLPLVYVRPAPKKHGLQNKVEGEIHKGQTVVVIEDLVSTGRSSLNAVKALKDSGAQVLGMEAIFSYGFDIARKNFEDENCTLHTLTTYNNLIKIAVEEGYLQENDLESLEEWRRDPSNWKK